MLKVVGCDIGGWITGRSRSVRTATVGCTSVAVGVGVMVGASNSDCGVETKGVATKTLSVLGVEISKGAVASGDGSTIVFVGGRVGTAVQVGGNVGRGGGVASNSATSV